MIIWYFEIERSLVPLDSAGCLQELGIGLIEMFQGLITNSQKEKAVQNSVVRYILHRVETDNVTGRYVAGAGVIKHTQLSSQK